MTVSCLFAISFGEKRVFGHGASLAQVAWATASDKIWFWGKVQKMKISQLPENIEVSLQNSVINPVKTFFLWWADLFNVSLTRSSKVECSTGSNNHLRSTDHFR